MWKAIDASRYVQVRSIAPSTSAEVVRSASRMCRNDRDFADVIGERAEYYPVADIAVQKIIDPNKPIDRVEVGVAAAAGSLSGGAGGVLVGAVGTGAISVGRAVVVQTIVNTVAGGAGSAAESAIKGEPITAESVSTDAIGSGLGGLAGSGVGAAMGDVVGPAAKGMIQRLSQSSAPGVPNIAKTTLSTGVAIPSQSAIQGAASQAGQAAAGAATSLAQKDLERKK